MDDYCLYVSKKKLYLLLAISIIFSLSSYGMYLNPEDFEGYRGLVYRSAEDIKSFSFYMLIGSLLCGVVFLWMFFSRKPFLELSKQGLRVRSIPLISWEDIILAEVYHKRFGGVSKKECEDVKVTIKNPELYFKRFTLKWIKAHGNKVPLNLMVNESASDIAEKINTCVAFYQKEESDNASN